MENWNEIKVVNDLAKKFPIKNNVRGASIELMIINCSLEVLRFNCRNNGSKIIIFVEYNFLKKLISKLIIDDLRFIHY